SPAVPFARTHRNVLRRAEAGHARRDRRRHVPSRSSSVSRSIWGGRRRGGGGLGVCRRRRRQRDRIVRGEPRRRPAAIARRSARVLRVPHAAGSIVAVVSLEEELPTQTGFELSRDFVWRITLTSKQ